MTSEPRFDVRQSFNSNSGFSFNVHAVGMMIDIQANDKSD